MIHYAVSNILEADTLGLVVHWEVLEENFLVDACHVHAGMLRKPGHLLFLIHSSNDWPLC